MKSIKSAANKIFSSNWTITIFATMIGVFAGIYLNGLFKESDLNKQTRIAMQRIEQEIASNRQRVLESYEENQEIFDITAFIFGHVDAEGGLVLKSSEMLAFQLKYPGVFTDIDSVHVKNDIYQYSGDLNFNIEPPSLTISNIAWTTFKNSQLIANTNYNCLYVLEFIDKLQNEVKKENAIMIKYFLGQEEKGDKGELFISQFRLLLDLEETLIESYESYDEEMKNCS